MDMKTLDEAFGRHRILRFIKDVSTSTMESARDALGKKLVSLKGCLALS